MTLTHLNPNRHRLNLTIRPNARALRVLFEAGSTGSPRATGVEVESGGERFVVEGDEIVLSGGAVASPHLLMVSGVGPRSIFGNSAYRWCTNCLVWARTCGTIRASE